MATGDFHSLAELAVLSSDGQQIVEVGWTVDRGLNGDDDPHLFVFHWVDGVGTCYNGCGFVPITDGSNLGDAAGMTLPVSATDVQQFWIQHHSVVAGTSATTVPGSGISRTRCGAAGSLKPARPSGSARSRTRNQTPLAARWATAPMRRRPTRPGSRMSGLSPDRGGPTPDITIIQTNPAYYTVLKTNSTSMSYGGQGACRTVPDVRGDNPDVLPNVLSAAGLVRGTVTAVPDRVVRGPPTGDLPEPRARLPRLRRGLGQRHLRGSAGNRLPSTAVT